MATIHRALDLGINLLDTSDAYGPFTNEQLIGKAIRQSRRASTNGVLSVRRLEEFVLR